MASKFPAEEKEKVHQIIKYLIAVVMQEHGAEVRPEVHRAATENVGKNWQWKEA